MDIELLLKEVSYKAIRSSGPGGQHANKVSSKVELLFDIRNSSVLTEEEKQLLIKNLSARLTNDAILILNAMKVEVNTKTKQSLKNVLLA